MTRIPVSRVTSYVCMSAVLLSALLRASTAAASGPDIILCDILSGGQYGRVGAAPNGIVGLSFGTAQASVGGAGLAWVPVPSKDHPVITENLYRLATVDGSVRFEQIGQSWAFNSYCPVPQSVCGTCSGGAPCGTSLEPGCSNPHSAGGQSNQPNLTSRAHIHPFTGQYADAFSDHSGHVHDGIAHRLQVPDADLMVPGAVYFVEAHCVTKDDAAAGNQFNNVGYRRVSVFGPTESGAFTFALAGATVREAPAIEAWTTAIRATVEPTPGADGRLVVAYEVTPLADGLYHYEYAVYNMNNDASVGAISVPVGDCINVTNIGFHAVRNHEAQGSAPGYSNDPWVAEFADGTLRWTTEPFAEDPDANAIRWGTLYNFRFDADQPPTDVAATLDLFKTGTNVAVVVSGPAAPQPLPADVNADCLADAADVAAFVGVVLGIETDPQIAARCDLNADGVADGGDAEAFVGALPGS